MATTDVVSAAAPRAPALPAGLKDPATARDALDADAWARVRALARARLVRSARTRTALPTAARDHALILVLGDMGLRSEEARSLMVSSIAAKTQ